MWRQVEARSRTRDGQRAKSINLINLARILNLIKGELSTPLPYRGGVFLRGGAGKRGIKIGVGGATTSFLIEINCRGLSQPVSVCVIILVLVVSRVRKDVA